MGNPKVPCPKCGGPKSYSGAVCMDCNLSRLRTGKLTHREYQIIQMRARGLTLKDTAFALGISFQTTRKHTEDAYRKLGVESITEAVYVLWLRDAWAA